MLILVMMELFKKGPRTLELVYENLTAVIMNIAPHISVLSQHSSLALIDIASKLSNPFYLKREAGHVRSLAYLIDSLVFLTAREATVNTYLVLLLG